MNFRQLAEKYYTDYLTDLDALVSIESTRDKEHASEGAPFGPAPRKALDTLLEMGKRDGFEAKDYDGYAGTLSYGDGEESVGILGHLDIVPLGEGWTKDPLKVTRENGYLFGRGVLDDKGPTLAAYYAMKMIKDAHIPLKRKVLLIAGCDEESGMECMKHYVKVGEIPTMGFTPDAEFPVIYGEKGNIHLTLNSKDGTIIESFDAGLRPNIVIPTAKAVLKTKEFSPELFEFYLKTNGLEGKAEVLDDGVHIEMKGEQAHASTPYLGTNAGVHLLNYIAQAYNDQLAADFHHLLKDWKGKPAGVYHEGLHMGFLTMNPGLISKDDKGLHALIDIRYPNDMTPEQVFNGFEEACTALSSEITPVLESAGKPLFVDPNSKLVKDLMGSYAKYSGDTFSPAITIGGGTYAKEFENFVAFGPEKGWEPAPKDIFVGGCHQRDEGIKEDSILEAMAIYADAIVRLAS